MPRPGPADPPESNGDVLGEREGEAERDVGRPALSELLDERLTSPLKVARRGEGGCGAVFEKELDVEELLKGM